LPRSMPVVMGFSNKSLPSIEASIETRLISQAGTGKNCHWFRVINTNVNIGSFLLSLRFDSDAR
jgi:hypothetical protein